MVTFDLRDALLLDEKAIELISELASCSMSRSSIVGGGSDDRRQPHEHVAPYDLLEKLSSGRVDKELSSDGRAVPS